MKVKFYATAMPALVLALTLIACTNEKLTEQGTSLPVGQYPLELTAASLNEYVATPVKAATRGTVDGNWEGVHSVAVRVNGKVKEYVVGSHTAGIAKLTCPDITKVDADFWWTKNNESKTVDAWYPYRGTQPTAWPISTTQTAETMAAEDLMYGYAPDMTQANPTIKFEHQLSKVEINLVNSDYLKRATEVKVFLDRQYETGTFSVDNGNPMFDGSTSDDANSTIIPCKLSSSNADYYASYQALVIPLDVVSGQNSNLNVIVDGVTYKYKLNTQSGYGNVFKSGSQYTFNITVKEHGLDVKVNETIGWETDGATGNGSVVLP